MKKFIFGLLGFIFALYANANNPFIGTWKLVSMTDWEPHPKGYLNYSPDGRMMVIITQSDRDVSSAESLFKSMNSYAGTYTVYPDRIVHHVEVSWNEKWNGTDQIRYYKLNDNQLTLSMPAVKDAEGNAVIYSLVWEKA